MIAHFFKLMWNKKKKHIVVIAELFFAYLVMCFLILLVSLSTSTFTEPNFNVDNVITVYPGISSDTAKTILRSVKEVKSISSTDLRPYANFTSNDTLYFNNQTIRVYRDVADEELISVLQISMASGRWFDHADRGSAKIPVVITTALQDELFPDIKPEGKTLRIGKTIYNIIGVANNLNDPTGNYQNRPHVFVMPYTSVTEPGNMFLVRLKKPMDEKIYHKLKLATSRNELEFSDNVIPASTNKAEYDSERNNIIGFMILLGSFLLINVTLGLFSILYQNINRRKTEIGVRRAAGATAMQIYWQIIIEVALLATIAIIPGAIVAIQFALFEVFGKYQQYYPSIISSIGVIYLVVVLCALYPAALASKIQPAIALHEE